MSEPALETERGSAWSWRADWTEPVRRRPVPVAVGAAVTVALFAWRIGLRPELVAFAYLGVVGVVLAVVDVELRRLPDPLTLPSYLVGTALLGLAVPFTAGGQGRFLLALIGLAALGGLFLIQWFVFPRAMGFGDVKLSGVLGLYLGWIGVEAWFLGLILMFVYGGVYSAILLITRRAGKGATIPFGPFMLAGALTGILFVA